MPHSTQNSVDSHHTFDLQQPDRTDSAVSNHSVDHSMKRHSRNASGIYGVAVTLESENDEKAALRSQKQQEQERAELKKLRRRSTPGTAGDYAAATGKGAAIAGRAVPADDARSQSFTDASKRKAQYHADQANAVKQISERAQKQSPVIAELKTNVIIKDEFTLVTDLSRQLAQRYSRSDSCILVKVDHSACLALGGTFEPCYLLTINAVPSQMGVTDNKRNALLIQAFMADILSVPAARGILTFTPIPEECLGTGGSTLQSDADKAEKPDTGVLKKNLDEVPKKPATAKRSAQKMEVEDKALIPAPAIAKKSSPDAITRASSPQIERPKTAHGGTSAPVNGLRMNPIAPDELTASKPLPNGRPRSVGAPERTTIPRQTGPQPIPNVTKQLATAVKPSLSSRPSAQSKSLDQNITKGSYTNVDARRTSPPMAPRLVQVQAKTYNPSAVTPFSTASTTSTKVSGPPANEEKRSKAVYLDMVTALPRKAEAIHVRSEELNPTHSNSGSDTSIPAARGSDRKGETTAPTPAPIITKRRSKTMTDKPKMPPMPPSPTMLDKEESRSISSRLSKRKSFMRIFKRESAVPAWYKQ